MMPRALFASMNCLMPGDSMAAIITKAVRSSWKQRIEYTLKSVKFVQTYLPDKTSSDETVYIIWLDVLAHGAIVLVFRET